ncbi:protein of unknown function (plasmid) [Methylocella tundrae]|uniref:Uncharacterized protein n=1 Tax=Methylocella tundrae TaxID=227605 RepID=A0A4U8Z7L1_METTU|nr:protein of unknown function [Methylocella tundrae]
MRRRSMNKIDLERNSAAAPPPIAGEEVICLFAFAQYDGALERRPPEAVLERRLILHRVGSVAALIGVVPVADYCGADAERRLADVAWLAPARAPSCRPRRLGGPMVIGVPGAFWHALREPRQPDGVHSCPCGDDRRIPAGRRRQGRMGATRFRPPR